MAGRLDPKVFVNCFQLYIAHQRKFHHQWLVSQYSWWPRHHTTNIHSSCLAHSLSLLGNTQINQLSDMISWPTHTPMSIPQNYPWRVPVDTREWINVISQNHIITSTNRKLRVWDWRSSIVQKSSNTSMPAKHNWYTLMEGEAEVSICAWTYGQDHTTSLHCKLFACSAKLKTCGPRARHHLWL